MCSYIFISGSEKLPVAFLKATSDTVAGIGGLKRPFNIQGRSCYSTIQYIFLLASISHVQTQTSNQSCLLCLSKNDSSEP